MFDVNLGEFGLIAVIAVIVVGPQRLPHYAQQIGRYVREARKMAMGLREQVREELGPEFDEVDWRKLDPRQYDPRRIIREALTETWEDEPPRTGSTAAGSAAAVGQGAGSDAPAVTGGADPTAGSSGPTGTGSGSTGTSGPVVPFDPEAT